MKDGIFDGGNDGAKVGLRVDDGFRVGLRLGSINGTTVGLTEVGLRVGDALGAITYIAFAHPPP